MDAVTFDLWFTLIWDDPQLAEYHRKKRIEESYQLLKPHSSNLTLDDVGRAFADSRVYLESGKRDPVETHPLERLRIVTELLKLRIDDTVLQEQATRFSDAGLEKPPYLNESAKMVLDSLHQRGVKMGLITNTERLQTTWRQVFDYHQISQYFDAISTSCEVGRRKPKKEIFTHCLDRLGTTPANTVHVGDSYKSDVEGALSAGIRPLLFKGLWNRYHESHYIEEALSTDASQLARNRGVSEITRLDEVLHLLD